MILELVENDPLIWPTVEENGVTRTKKYGLPADIYSLVNHHIVAKYLWERVQLVMQGTSLTKQERECKMYDAFSKFVTDVKLVKDSHTTNFDQLHAYFEQHELDVNEVRLLCKRNQDPLAFVANQHMTPPHFNTYQSSYNNPQLQQQFPPSQYGSIHPTQHYSSRDDPFACLNKAMAFLTVVASLRFPSTNNQLRKSSNTRNQATIWVTMQQVQGRQGQSYSGSGYKSNATTYRGNNTSGQARVVKCYNYQGEGHMAKQ
nr:hypothetical protein [Tanacetum cinerariifolium]